MSANYYLIQIRFGIISIIEKETELEQAVSELAWVANLSRRVKYKQQKWDFYEQSRE